MTDEFNKGNKQREIDDFFDKFDKISNEFDRSINRTDKTEDTKSKLNQDTGRTVISNLNDIDEHSPALPDQPERKTRLERLSESKPQNLFTKISDKISSQKSSEPTENKGNTNVKSTLDSVEGPMKKKKKKKYSLNKKQFFKFILFTCLIFIIILGAVVTSIIVTTPPIKPENIYSLLAENSVLYDDEGNIVDSILTSEGLRTNVSYSDLPDDLVNAFVSIEDKTFWDHNGFNFVRILGAIKESVFEGGSISGTSTITQQLARNLYLAETKADYSLTRKIKEAYYAVLLERHLSKEQIIEAYLNTIFLGYNSNGVQAASQAYFSKDVSELTLEECAALASLPQAPDRLALIKRYESDQVEADNPNILRRGDIYTLVYNDAVKDRKNLVLSFMYDQGKISKEELETAQAADLKLSMNPSEDTSNEISSYFADFTIKEVVKDLMKEYDIDESKAKQMIYNSGLRIYTTMNTNMQKIAEQEFTNNGNFPKVTGLKKDGAGNVLNSNGGILLYSYDNYFDSEGNFTLSSDEYTSVDNGGIKLFKGKRLNFYKTEVQGQIDYSVEFKDMYVVQDGIFYSMKGGVIQIPQQYKSKDEDGNLIIDGKFFEEKPDFFEFIPSGIKLGNSHYVLKQKIIQPQSAMVIFDYKTGGIKAMVGGRNIEGRLLFNRATSPRQPGSAIKPMGVYGPALQSAVDKANSGQVNSASEGNSYGNLWTAASVIDDAPLTIQGKLWPKNWYNGYRGLYTMRQSIEQSVNVNAVKVFSEIGVSNSVSFLKKLGVTSIIESGNVNDMNAAALALGGMSKGVSPLEMVAGYGSFANQGFYTEPISYTKVTNKRGEVILENSAAKEQVMDKGVAFIITDMLRTTVTNGIAKGAAIGSQPVAGKTGTTSDNYDAWFVGFTPQYAASVWIGNDVNIELSQGSAAAAKLWSKIMKQAHSGIASGSFPSADNVISVAIDSKSGRLPSELSALDSRGTVINEYFVRGTEPTTTDNVHVSVTVCSDSGYLATPYCPNAVTKVAVKRPYAVNPSVGDIEYEAPGYYCNLHNLDTSTYPIDPNATLNPDFNWDGNPGGGSDNEDGGIIINPGDNNHKPDDENAPPDWLNFLN
ncbi:transglycosylase domain-containing protein [Clostridiales bacterium BAD-6]|uniref:Penicillin-binding protein 1A n=1 Tax=Sinanaerobacter chloroacetimidivorans TaxID=2818044 RepID=A0A8J8B278_9FIRM|nr:transglycosylase domain-containing protein [Sinanaerobacter chloroacetimidivorans]